jgi:hypothetical protein
MRNSPHDKDGDSMSGTKTKTKATVSAAYGKTLREHGLDVDSIPFEFDYDELDSKNPEHVAEAKREFTDEDVIQTVNAKRKAAARAKVQKEVLEAKGIKAPEKDEPEVIYRNLMAQFKLAKMAEDEARKLAAQISGYTPSA